MRLQINSFDDFVLVFQIGTFMFWFLSKTTVACFTLFGVFYELGVFFALALAFVCPVYFLIKWVISKFSFKKYYFYWLLFGLATILIMRYEGQLIGSGC
jgi:hypothetical protein